MVSKLAISWLATSAMLLFVAGGSGSAAGAADETSGNDGRLAFSIRDWSSRDDWEIFVVNGDGSGRRNLSRKQDSDDGDPAWSPDGTRVAFVACCLSHGPKSSPQAHGIYVRPLDGSALRRLTRGETDAAPTWSPDGTTIAFQRGNDVYRVNADGTTLRRLAVGGQAPEWSPDGRKIVFQRAGGIITMRPDGRGQRRLTAFGDLPRWSPDARTIAFDDDCYPTCRIQGIWVVSTDGGPRRQLHKTGFSPAWSPDGARIAFADENGIFAMNADGSGVRRLSRATGSGLDWSPDGRQIAFLNGCAMCARAGIWVVRADGSGKTKHVFKYGGDQTGPPVWSPVV